MTAPTVPAGYAAYAAEVRALAARILATLPPEPEHLIRKRSAVHWQLDAAPPRAELEPQRLRPPPRSATCVCRGSGWVCEDHPTVPYAADITCPCDAPGAPCPDCTPEDTR